MGTDVSALTLTCRWLSVLSRRTRGGALATRVGIRVATLEVLVADQPTCLCIISGERIRGGDFIAALRASLRPHDQLEIIVDRPGDDTQGEWERAEDRRRRTQAEAALRTNGFPNIAATRSA